MNNGVIHHRPNGNSSLSTVLPDGIRESKHQNEGGERMSEGIAFSTNHDDDSDWILYEDAIGSKRCDGSSVTKVSYHMLMRLTPHLSHWASLTFKKTYEIMEKMDLTRFHNCEITPAWYIKTYRGIRNDKVWSVSVWPCERTSNLMSNNWGEEE